MEVERDTATGFPNYSWPFAGEEVAVHNIGISGLHLSTNLLVIWSPPAGRQETRLIA